MSLGTWTHRLLDKAPGQCGKVAGQLKAVTQLYPPFRAGEDEIEVDGTNRAAVEVPKKAKEAEAAGLEALSRIATGLGSP